MYTLRLYDTVFHHHKKHFGKGVHEHKHGHGHHKHGSKHHSKEENEDQDEGGANVDADADTDADANSRRLAGTSKKGTSGKAKKKDVKDAFQSDSSINEKNKKVGDVATVFQKVDQKVSQYQAIIDEVTKAIETAKHSDVYLVRKLALWVHRMNVSSHTDFPYDPTLPCPSTSSTSNAASTKSSRSLNNSEENKEESESEESSESESGSEAAEPVQQCRFCRHQDISLKHLPDILDIKLNLAKFNISSRAQSSKTVKLKNGVSVPRIGFGCGMLGSGSEAEEAMYNAIKAGYRHFDTAQGYSTDINFCYFIYLASASKFASSESFCCIGNEEELGRAMKRAIDEKLVTRKQMFIATKLTFCTQYEGYKGVKAAVKDQLDKLQTTYIDMYMFHCYVADPNKLGDMWRAFEDLNKEGKIKSIGYGNIPEKELKRFYERAKVKPMFSQDKVDVYHIGRTADSVGEDLVTQARNYKMKIVAYSPLSAWPFVLKPADDPIVLSIAHRLDITPGQVVLKWLLQLDFIPLTRATSAEHLEENLQVFKIPPLSETDMRLLACLSYLISNPFHRYVPL